MDVETAATSEMKSACSVVLVKVEEDQQLLGSVTTYNNTDGSEIKSQQIRSSARVFKKMKLDVSVPLVAEKREKKEDVKQDSKKCYRPLWTSDDKTMFFEALNEFGKDFESIQSYISTKLKKKGVPDNQIKTKDQVRHLYYRTWHKISKHLKFAEGIKKVVQELYALINYGEFRKKIGSVSEKSCMKLNELIYRGSIVLRIKGKNVRIRTPMCRALRRLNQLDDNYDEIKLPNRVVVEIRPKDMTSYLKVQNLAQNPRLKTVMPLQKRLSSLISCINKRWKNVDAKMFEKASVSTTAVTNDCVPSEQDIQSNKEALWPSMRLTPPKNCQIELPSINLCEYFTRQSICLNSYESRLGIKPEDCTYFNNLKMVSKNSPKKNAYRPRTDSVSDKTNKNDAEDGEKTPNVVEKVVDEVVNTILALQQMENGGETKETKEEEEAARKKLLSDNLNAQRAQQIEAIRKGWTEETSQTLTIGEVYLMFGSDSKLILEYSWDETASPKIDEAQNSEFKVSSELSVSLQKLLSVAKMHYRKNVIKCPCGHVCGNPKNNTVKKSVAKQKPVNEEEKVTVEDTYILDDNAQDMDQQHPKVIILPQRLQPILPKASLHIMSPMDSLPKLMPKFCNRKGRKPRSKQVVVERKLPLLPNNMESGHQFVRMNIISQTTANPVILESNIATDSADKEVDTINLGSNCEEQQESSTNLLAVSPSPSAILLEGDNQWINAEVADYSLSSLLGHLESPIKSGMVSEDTRMSEDVDAQLRCLLTESSVDFSANFADLAAQVSEIKK